MRWNKLRRKILKKKPYLLDPLRARSHAEAKALLRQAGLPPASESLEAARIRANYSVDEWEALTGLSEPELRKKCRKAEPVQIGHAVLLSKRAAVSFALVLLLAFFMVFTAPGRALARCIYNAVSSIIEDILHVRAAEDDGESMAVMPAAGETLEIVKFDSMDALADHVHYPVYYLADEDIKISEITLRSCTNSRNHAIITT